MTPYSGNVQPINAMNLYGSVLLVVQVCLPRLVKREGEPLTFLPEVSWKPKILGLNLWVIEIYRFLNAIGEESKFPEGQ